MERETFQKIAAELDRLGVSVKQDPSAGLAVEGSEEGVKIYDRYFDGVYKLSVLSTLENLSPSQVTLGDDKDGCLNIWNVISDFEL